MISKYKTPIILLILFTCSYLLAFPDVQYNEYFTDEDSWIENMSALAFLVAAVLFFLCFWRSKGNGNNLWKFKTSRNLVYLGLGLLFFVAFGEEISWGQRIFGWATPESLAEVNYQQETNIHNLDFFTFKDEAGDSFWSFLFVLNAGRIFFYFWFSFLILLPLANYFSAGLKKIINKINIPVPPMWLGGLMISNLLLSKLYKVVTADYPENYTNSIDEIMEGNYAIVIAALAIYFFVNKIYSLEKKDLAFT